jgi:hypothetical protein
MAMLHKWATGSHTKDNQKNTIQQASGDFAYELPNSAPSEVSGTAKAADQPYTKFVDTTSTVGSRRGQYSTDGTQNLGRGNGPSAGQPSQKLDGTSVIDQKILPWYNLAKMWKFRKILKLRNKVGVNPDAVTTNLYEA